MKRRCGCWERQRSGSGYTAESWSLVAVRHFGCRRFGNQPGRIRTGEQRRRLRTCDPACGKRGLGAGPTSQPRVVGLLGTPRHATSTGSGSITTADALLILKASVGQVVTLACP